MIVSILAALLAAAGYLQPLDVYGGPTGVTTSGAPAHASGQAAGTKLPTDVYGGPTS